MMAALPETYACGGGNGSGSARPGCYMIPLQQCEGRPNAQYKEPVASTGAGQGGWLSYGGEGKG